MYVRLYMFFINGLWVQGWAQSIFWSRESGSFKREFPSTPLTCYTTLIYIRIHTHRCIYIFLWDDGAHAKWINCVLNPAGSGRENTFVFLSILTFGSFRKQLQTHTNHTVCIVYCERRRKSKPRTNTRVSALRKAYVLCPMTLDQRAARSKKHTEIEVSAGSHANQAICIYGERTYDTFSRWSESNWARGFRALDW